MWTKLTKSAKMAQQQCSAWYPANNLTSSLFTGLSQQSQCSRDLGYGWTLGCWDRQRGSNAAEDCTGGAAALNTKNIKNNKTLNTQSYQWFPGPSRSGCPSPAPCAQCNSSHGTTWDRGLPQNPGQPQSGGAGTAASDEPTAPAPTQKKNGTQLWHDHPLTKYCFGMPTH